jgi:polyhydroxybutyrate depolymerase
MRNYARKDFQKYWPEALLVSPQGLNTPGIISDPQGLKPGWQRRMGDQNDRDLHFVDAILKTLHEEYQADSHRIYVTGHSNGGGFTYLLLVARPNVFAAFAPSAAGSAALRNPVSYTPAPVFHLAGEKDTVVPFENQKRTIATVRKLNQCSDEGKEWTKQCTIYESKVNAPVVSYIHSGNHAYPDQANALIVKFFKQHERTK